MGALGLPLLKLAGKLGLKYGAAYYTENYGRGPSALNAVQADVDELTDGVYRYSATLQKVIAYVKMPSAAGAERCTVVYRPDEVETAKAIVDELRKFKSRIDSVAEGAGGRAAQDEAEATKRKQEALANLAYVTNQGNNQVGVRAFSREVGVATEFEVFGDANLIVIKRKQARLDQQVQTLVDEMDTNVAMLEAMSRQYLQSVRDCQDWMVKMER